MRPSHTTADGRADRCGGSITKNVIGVYVVFALCFAKSLDEQGLCLYHRQKAYVVLNEYFRYLYREELIPKNPMANVEMIKKSNFLSAQNKKNRPECETVTVFTAVTLISEEKFFMYNGT